MIRTAAATLAIDLLDVRPGVADRTAAHAAWQAFSDDETRGPLAFFQATNYLDAVVHVMQEIRAGRMARVEHRPPMLEKAGKLLTRP